MSKVKELRLEKKLTQQQVADLVGISLRSYKSYENDKDKGFLLLGVYSSTNREAEVKGVLKDAGTTYPILKYTGNFNIFKSQ